MFTYMHIEKREKNIYPVDEWGVASIISYCVHPVIGYSV